MREILVVMLLVVGFLSGCTTIAAYRATEVWCRKENTQCGENRDEEEEYAIEMARKAFEVDREIAKAVVETLASDDPGAPSYLATAEETCAIEQRRVCSTNGGCLCEPLDTQ